MEVTASTWLTDSSLLQVHQPSCFLHNQMDVKCKAVIWVLLALCTARTKESDPFVCVSVAPTIILQGNTEACQGVCFHFQFFIHMNQGWITNRVKWAHAAGLQGRRAAGPRGHLFGWFRFQPQKFRKGQRFNWGENPVGVHIMSTL